MGKSQELYEKAKKIIPGGTQLLSKRPERFLPDGWPAYYDKAEGCQIWDLDGKRYIDMSNMGVGSCLLGYADKDVDNAVKVAIEKGSMSTLNCPEEVALAQLLCEIHPWANMVRFARTGGEAMAISVRIARAKTNKDLVLFCGYHGWHDWYLSANIADDRALDGHLLLGLEPRGIPRALKGTAIPFSYNETDRFLELVKRHEKDIAAVVMEPIRSYYPVEGFLETVREVTQKSEMVLIFDEVTSGWRLNIGGAHLRFSVNPDMAVFAKGISNGYPMAAIIGRSEVMEYAQATFISSTYWTERVGPVAALATIKKMQDRDIPRYLGSAGQKVQEGWKTLAEKYKVGLKISGTYPLGHFSFDYENPLLLKTLFVQSMLERGFLATTAFYASYAHTEDYVDNYLTAVDETFCFMAKVIDEGNPWKYLKGSICESDFRRLT